MSPRARILPCALSALLAWLAVLPPIVRGEPESADPMPGETIAWMDRLPAAFQRAAAEKKVVMICINARNAVGEREEPAAKGLREIVYLDPAVVEKSRKFVCVLLTAEGTSEDYGELRYRFGIDGNIVSPQHIFTRPDHAPGAEPLVREEYWSYGAGEPAVRALLRLMDEALAVCREQDRASDEPGGGDPLDASPPASGTDRTAWIETLTELVRDRDASRRRRALGALAAHDREGDCLGPLIPLLEELEKGERTGALVAVVRTLGVPGLDAAAAALHALLKHKDIHVRANVAVTLEYIGCSASVSPLLAAAKRETDEGIANHMYRAIGRCGVGDAAARRGLLRRARPGKEGDFGSFGPVIGLAYGEGDAKTARAVEKQLLKLGPPFQEGKKPHTFLRVLLIWCLGEIRDPETAPFLRKRVLKPLEAETSSWKGKLVELCDAVVRTCEGDEDAPKDVDAAMLSYVDSGNARALADRARRGRAMRRFVPKGEWENTPAVEED